MKSNVQITALQKEFKNGLNGFEVKVEGMEGKLDCSMNFTEPLKAMRYMFLLSKRLELQIDNIQLAAVSLAYQRAKMAEQKAVDDANSAIAELGDCEKEPEETPEPAEPLAESNEPEEIQPTPMVKQYKELKEKHPEALLLFRCGDFYETYLNDAEDASQILGITLTRRSSDNIAMAGFPYHALDSYLPKLIRAGRRVAICDQIEDPGTKTLVKRGITELVTPSEAPKRRGRKPKAEVAQQELNMEVAE